MSYKPQTTNPLIFAYNTSSQTLFTNTVLTLDASLYNGTLSNNELSDTEKCTILGDVKYTMSTAGLRSYTALRREGTETVSQGFNIHGEANAANGVSDELSYATFEKGSFDLFCDPKHTNNLTMQAERTRMTGARIS